MVNLIHGPNATFGNTRPVDFIRHGSTEMNGTRDTDRIRGWIDVPLDDKGIKEAEKIGRHLALLKTKPRVLFSSNLQRAVHTAHIISQTAGIPLAPPMQSMRPWNLGHFQGMESSKIAPQIKMFVNNPGQRVPGNGESFNEFVQRFITGLRGILVQTQHRPGLVSHHRNERLMSALQKQDWRGFDKPEFLRHGSAPGVLITFELPNGQDNKGRSQLPLRAVRL